MLVQRLFPNLPAGYTAEPRVRLGRLDELDIGGFEGDENESPRARAASGGVATAPYAAPRPTRFGEPLPPLPPLPLWLDADLAVSLDLEGGYEDTCRVLRIV